MTKQAPGSRGRGGDMGLLLAVGLGAFVLGGFVIGAVVMWRISASPKPSARKTSKASTTPRQTPQTRPRTRTIKRSQPLGVDQRQAVAPPSKRHADSRDAARKQPPLKQGTKPKPGQRTPPRKRPQATSSGGGQMWGAPNWIFDPSGGLIGKLRLVTLKEIKALLGFSHLRGAILQGIPRSGTYDAVQFQPTKPLPKAPDAQFGLGIQLWLHPQPGPILQRWRRYQRGYPNARMLPVAQRIGRDSFVARRAPIAYILFRTSRRNGLVILSCHQALCQRKAMVTLAKRIDARIQ